jgi:general stress protein CsbA
VTAVLIPPLAILWGLVDRSRWSTVVLGVAVLAVAVMLYRMQQIWFVQVA